MFLANLFWCKSKGTLTTSGGLMHFWEIADVAVRKNYQQLRRNQDTFVLIDLT